VFKRDLSKDVCLYKFENLINRQLKVCLFALVLLVSNVMKAENDIKDAKQTESYWLVQISTNPSLALNHFNLGVVYQKNQKFDLAISCYNKVIELESPLSPVARFYKARALESIGKIEDAKNVLTEIEIDTVPQNIKTKVLDYKNSLFASSGFEASQADEADELTESEEKRFSGYLSLTLGQNSNPETYTDTQSSSIKKDSQISGSANLNYLLSYSSYHELSASYSFSSTNYSRATSSNDSSHEISLPVSFYFWNSRVTLEPLYSRDFYGGSLYSESVGANLSLSLKISDNYLNVGIQNVKSTNKTTTYSYLTGPQNKYYLSYDIRWVRTRLVLGFYRYETNYVDSSTLASSYKSNALYVNYYYNIGSYDFSISSAFETRDYVKISGSTQRADKKISLGAEAGYNFKNNLRVFLEYSNITNSSNYNTTTDDRAYKQNQAAVGLTYSW
jgi:tetratricopeptide (TPR) repeat protein